MSGSILPVYRLQVFVGATPAAGAKLYSFLSGTSSAYPLYADAALGTMLSNPVVADGSGIFPIMYMAAVNYRIRIDQADGSPLYLAQDGIYDLWQLTAGTPQAANTFFAGPASGVAAAPSFRALVVADLPTAAIDVGLCEGRLTLASGTPVTTADVTAGTTIFWTPYKGNRVALYDGSTWSLYTFTELSIAIPATTSQMYDVFLFDNNGTRTLELAAWTNDTTRASALTTQDGVYVKTGVTTRRLLGSFRTTAVSGQTADSTVNRSLANYYHRVSRPLLRQETTASWNYTLLALRQANASTSNQISHVVCVAEDFIDISLITQASNGSANATLTIAIGNNSTTTAATGSVQASSETLGGVVAGAPTQLVASWIMIPAVGYHTYTWLEESEAAGTTTWQGLMGSGLSAEWRA